jgi:hypothetical protein
MPALGAGRVTVVADGGRAYIFGGNVGCNPSASFIGFAIGDACFGADARDAGLRTGRRGIPDNGRRRTWR